MHETEPLDELLIALPFGNPGEQREKQAAPRFRKAAAPQLEPLLAINKQAEKAGSVGERRTLHPAYILATREIIITDILLLRKYIVIRSFNSQAPLWLLSGFIPCLAT